MMRCRASLTLPNLKKHFNNEAIKKSRKYWLRECFFSEMKFFGFQFVAIKYIMMNDPERRSRKAMLHRRDL